MVVVMVAYRGRPRVVAAGVAVAAVVVASVDKVVADLLLRVAETSWIPVIAVDGRSGSGKSTTAQRLAAAVPGAVVLHTDDVAWHHSFFDWTPLLRDGVLQPVRERRLPVRCRPPAWSERSRPGAIEVSDPCRLVIVEGVGAGRLELANLVDVLVWVQSDAVEARRRGIERDGGVAAAAAFWDECEAQEVLFLADHRPWDRADLVICGTPALPHDANRDLIVGHPAHYPARSTSSSPRW